MNYYLPIGSNNKMKLLSPYWIYGFTVMSILSPIRQILIVVLSETFVLMYLSDNTIYYHNSLVPHKKHG